MATYPIKMLKDETGAPFVPLVSTNAVQTTSGQTVDQLWNSKIEASNIIAGSNINLSVSGNNVTINVDGDTISTSAQTFTGVKTFGSFPECSGTPTLLNQLVNKDYVDDSIANYTYSYSSLTNLPILNGVTINGTLTSTDLGLQEALDSGTNIKTINGTSLLGSGDLSVGVTPSTNLGALTFTQDSNSNMETTLSSVATIGLNTIVRFTIDSNSTLIFSELNSSSAYNFFLIFYEETSSSGDVCSGNINIGGSDFRVRVNLENLKLYIEKL